MQIQKSVSAQSVEDFRAAVADSFDTNGAVLLNLIEALAVGPRAGAPVEVSESAVFAYGHDSLYQGLRRAAAALGQEIDSDDWLLALRQARLAWLAAHPPPAPLRADLGAWKIRILDASNHYRPQVKTVRVGYVHGAEGMKRALRAGVTTIEHGTFMDDEAIALFKEKGAYLVPTIIAGKSTADSAKIPGYFHPLVQPKAVETGQFIQATFAKAYKAGVKICFGTDAGVFKHGLNAKEFQYMTEAGMPSMEAIQAATMTNATVLDMKTELGSIETGKLADIIATDGDPLSNIATLMNVTFVMKDGKIYKR